MGKTGSLGPWGTGAESKFIVASFPFAKIIVLFEGSFWQKDSLPQYSRVRKKHTGTIINFSGFWLCIKVSNLCYLRGDYVYSRGFVYCFCQMLNGLCLFKGVRLFRTLEYTITLLQGPKDPVLPTLT